MAIEYEKIQLIDDRTKSLVSGYMRTSFDDIYPNVPLITFTCLSFYYSLEISEMTKFLLAKRSFEIYRIQLKYMKDHLSSLESLITDKGNVIQNLLLRYNLGTFQQNTKTDKLSSDEAVMIDLELRKKAETLAIRACLENWELRQSINQLRDENFHLDNDRYELQDKINRQQLQIGKLERTLKELDEEEEVLEAEVMMENDDKTDADDNRNDNNDILTELYSGNINYINWNITEIMIWIKNLENGRYDKYIDILTNGFIANEINGGDLEGITSSDLSSRPYNIMNFRDKKDLVKHFKSLSKSWKQDYNDTTLLSLSHSVL